MTKRLLFGLILWTAFTSRTQESEIILRARIQPDSVFLRWAPANANLLKEGLLSGYQIERIQGENSFANNATLKVYEIQPFDKRYEHLKNSDDSSSVQWANLIQGFIHQSTLQPQDLQMAYASLILGASVNRRLADLLGLSFRETCSGNEIFRYRVRLASTKTYSNEVLVNTSLLSMDREISTLSAQAGKRPKQVYLQWEAASLQTDYAAYWVERSEDSIHFETRNSSPYLFLKSTDEPSKINCDYVDTGIAKGHTYFYRIRGVNHFAQTGLPSNTIQVYIPQSLDGEIHLDSIKAEGKKRLVFGEFLSNETHIHAQTYVLLRSDSLMTGYRAIQTQNVVGEKFRFECESNLESGDRFYYVVGAVSPDHDTLFSFPYYFFTLEQIPPSIPTGLRGQINDSGIVSLEWTAVSEADLRGYRVYRSNSLKEEFIELTSEFQKSAFFTDTLALNTLTSEVYYRIAAVDLNFNNSAPSEVLKLFKPDTIAPVSALFTDFSVSSAGVYLAWINSSSEDVHSSQLIRQSPDKIDTLLTWKSDKTSFTDTSAEAGSLYLYSLYTTDFSGNHTNSTPVQINFEPGFRTAVTDFQGIANRELKQIELFWKLSVSDIYAIQIYRAKNDGNYVLFQTLRNENLNNFFDKDLQINNTYRYKIKVIFRDGSSTALSAEVKIVY